MSELNDVMKEINTSFGDNTIRPATNISFFKYIPFGVFALDYALLGGLPEGFATMIFGYESSGKTTLALRAVANHQKKYPGKQVVWVDTEKTFDPLWATKHGVNLDRCNVSDPDTGEQAVDIIDGVMGAEDVSCVVLDSVPSTVPYVEAEKSAEDAIVAERARLMGRLCSKILVSWAKERRRNHWVTVILINQWRFKIGLVFGDPRILPGGKQLNYLVSTKIEIKNKEITREVGGSQVLSRNQHSFIVSKAKVPRAIKSGEFELIVDETDPLGIGTVDDSITVASYGKKFGMIVGKKGSWRITGSRKVFSGEVEIVKYLNDDSEAKTELMRNIIASRREDKGMERIPPDNYLLGWVK